MWQQQKYSIEVEQKYLALIIHFPQGYPLFNHLERNIKYIIDSGLVDHWVKQLVDKGRALSIVSIIIILLAYGSVINVFFRILSCR